MAAVTPFRRSPDTGLPRFRAIEDVDDGSRWEAHQAILRRREGMKLAAVHSLPPAKPRLEPGYKRSALPRISIAAAVLAVVALGAGSAVFLTAHRTNPAPTPAPAALPPPIVATTAPAIPAAVAAPEPSAAEAPIPPHVVQPRRWSRAEAPRHQQPRSQQPIILRTRAHADEAAGPSRHVPIGETAEPAAVRAYASAPPRAEDIGGAEDERLQAYRASQAAYDRQLRAYREAMAQYHGREAPAPEPRTRAPRQWTPAYDAAPWRQ